ncbi:MAG: hypothetical protein IJM14_10100 [Lachnospiraceae bacterium]|nr:hypothetical protein [Lachnospiraceae bacterium]
MARYIDADVLKSSILQWQFKIGQDGVWYVLGLIDSTPTVEAEPNSCEYWDGESHFCALRRPQTEPVKHGKWIEEVDYDYDNFYRCSACGEPYVLIEGTPKENLYNYCPNCGAKMDESTMGQVKHGHWVNEGEKE